jgi:hypothetical protein
MAKVFLTFGAAAAIAKALAIKRQDEVWIEILQGGWSVNDYCSWVGELGEHAVEFVECEENDRSPWIAFGPAEWQDDDEWN